MRCHCGWWRPPTSTLRCRSARHSVVPEGPEGLSVRWVILHVINELARHAGHADIIRETIDGATMYELIAGLENWEVQGGFSLGRGEQR